MLNKLLILFLALFLCACGAKEPTAYSNKNGEFRPINTLDRYTELDKQKALKTQAHSNKKAVYNSDTNAWE